MRARLTPRRPSPAMVVALLALSVSLGGTGYAMTGGNFNTDINSIPNQYSNTIPNQYVNTNTSSSTRYHIANSKYYKPS